MGSAKYTNATKATAVLILVAAGAYCYERYSYTTTKECALKMVSRLGLSGKPAIQLALQHCATVKAETAKYDFSDAENPFEKANNNSNKP